MNAAEAMWDHASRDVEAERGEQRLALAKVRCGDVWPFLAAARTPQEYHQRRALAAERVEAGVASVQDDPELLRQVWAGLDEDFRVLSAARAEVADQDDDPVADDQGDVGAPGTTAAHRTGSCPRCGSDGQFPAGAMCPLCIGTGDAPPGQAASYAIAPAAARRPSLASATALRARLASVRTADLDSDDSYERDWTADDDRMHELGYSHGLDDAEQGRRPGGYEHQDPVYQDAYDTGFAEGTPQEEEPTHTRPARPHHPASLRVVCRKCTSGRTPDGEGCSFCGGVGSLDEVTAAVKEADGWGQGLGAVFAALHTAPGGGPHAPYTIEQRGEKYVVLNALGEVKDTFDTEQEARDYQKALYANVPGAAEQVKEGVRKRAGDDGGSWVIKTPYGHTWNRTGHGSREEAEEELERLRRSYRSGSGLHNIMPDPADFEVHKAAVYHPDGYGSARYEDVTSPPRPGWVHDPWVDANPGIKAGDTPVDNTADGTEMRPSDTIRRQRPEMSQQRRAGQDPVARTQAAQDLFAAPPVVHRIAAEAMATNPELGAERALALAREVVQRYPGTLQPVS